MVNTGWKFTFTLADSDIAYIATCYGRDYVNCKKHAIRQFRTSSMETYNLHMNSKKVKDAIKSVAAQKVNATNCGIL